MPENINEISVINNSTHKKNQKNNKIYFYLINNLTFQIISFAITIIIIIYLSFIIKYKLPYIVIAPLILLIFTISESATAIFVSLITFAYHFWANKFYFKPLPLFILISTYITFLLLSLIAM